MGHLNHASHLTGYPGDMPDGAMTLEMQAVVRGGQVNRTGRHSQTSESLTLCSMSMDDLCCPQVSICCVQVLDQISTYLVHLHGASQTRPRLWRSAATFCSHQSLPICPAPGGCLNSWSQVFPCCERTPCDVLCCCAVSVPTSVMVAQLHNTFPP